MTISKSSIAAVEDPVTLGAIETANGSFADTPERRAYLNATESAAVQAANDAAGFQNAVTRALQPDPNAVLDALDAQKMIEPSTRVRNGIRAARTMAYARDILKNPDRYQDGDAFAALNALSKGFAKDVSEWKRVQGMTDDPRQNLATYVNMLDGCATPTNLAAEPSSPYANYYEAIRSQETRDWDALDSAPIDVRFSHAIGNDPGGKRFTDAAKDWVHANLFDEDTITPEEEAAWIESEGGRESDAMRRYFANLYARGKSAKEIVRDRERQQALEGDAGVLFPSKQDDGRIPDQEWKVNQRMNKDGTFTHDRIDTLTNLTLEEYAETEKRRDAFIMKRRTVDAYQKRMDQKKAEDRAHAMLPFLNEYEAAAALSAMRGEDMSKYKSFFENGFGNDTERRNAVWSVCASLRPRDAHGAWEDLVGRFGEGVDRAALLSGKAASSLWNSYTRWPEIIGTRIGAGREAAIAEKRLSDEELKQTTKDMRFALQYRQTMEAWIPNNDDNFAEQAVKGLADSGFLQGAAITGSLAHVGGSALLRAPHPAAKIGGAVLHAAGFLTDAFAAASMIGDSFENMMLNGVDAERAAVVGLYAGSLNYLIEKGNVDMFLGKGLSPAELRRTGFRALFKAIARKDPKLIAAAIKADVKQAGRVALSECAEEFGQVLVDSGALKFAKGDEFSVKAFANAYLNQDTLKDGIDGFIDAIPTCTGFGLMANHTPLRSKNAQAVDAYEQLAEETAKRYALQYHVDTANAEDMAKVKRLVLENAARHARTAANMNVEQRRAYFGQAAQEAGMSPSEAAFYEQAADLYQTLTAYEGQQFADAAMHGEINEAVLDRAGIAVGHDANGDINAVTIDGHTRTVVTEHGARTATDTHTGETGNVRGYYDPKDDAIHITVPETVDDVGETARTTTAPHELLHASLEAMANDPALTEEQRQTLDALLKTETPSPTGTQLDANEAAARFVERVFAVANRNFTPDREVVAIGNIVRNIGTALKNALGAKSEYLPAIVKKAGKGGISITDLLDPSFLADLDALQIAAADKGTADPVVAWYANTMQPFFKALVDAKSRTETTANLDAAEASTAAERGDTRGDSAAAGITFEDTTSSIGDLEPVADTSQPSQSSQPSQPSRQTMNLPNGYTAEYELEEMPLSYVVMPGDPDYDQNLANLYALQEAEPDDGVPVIVGGGNLLCGVNAIQRALAEGKTRIAVRRIRRLRKDKQPSDKPSATQEAKRTGVRRFVEVHGNAYPALRYWLDHGRHIIDGSDPYIKTYLANLSPADRMFLTGFGKGGTTADHLVEDFLNQYRSATETANERHYDGTMKPEDVLDQALRERDAYRQWKADGALSPDEQQARDEHDKFIFDGHTEDEWKQHLEDLGNPLLGDETTTASDAESAAIDAQIAEDAANGFFSLVREYDDILGDKLAALDDAPRYSLSPSADGERYSWDRLSSLPNMRLTQIDPNKFKNYKSDAERIADAYRSIVEAGGEKIGDNHFITMDGEKVLVGSDGIKHRGKTPNLANDFLFPNLGNVLKNAVRVNELNPRVGNKKDDFTTDTFVYLGAMAYGNEVLPVRIQVAHRGNNNRIDRIDVLKSLNTKIGTVATLGHDDPVTSVPSGNYATQDANAPLATELPLASLPNISIADLIRIAQPLHPQIFSRDVANALGVPYEGDAIDARYSLARTPAEQTVYDRYHDANGKPRNGWMKAPNGKPTRLTERQWLQVRTQAFKAWFGDWEKKDNVNRAVDFALNGAPVATISGNEFEQSGNHDLIDRVSAFYEEIGGSVENEDLGTIILDRDSVKSSLGHGIGRAKAAAFAAVPDVLRKGIVFDHQVNWKNRGTDTFVLCAPIDIGNDTYVCEAIVEQRVNGKERRFYLHEVNLQSSLAETIKTPTGGADNGKPSRPVRSIIAKLADEIQSASVSKVVDENGEPLVVYHDSSEKHNILSRDYARKSMDIEAVFFHLKRDENHEYGDVEHAVFLNIRNPANFKQAHEGFEYGVTDDAGVKQREKLQSEGFDGAIFDADTMGGEDLAEAFVFESTQIKSATANVGAFDRTNQDIRFSLHVNPNLRSDVEAALMKRTSADDNAHHMKRHDEIVFSDDFPFFEFLGLPNVRVVSDVVKIRKFAIKHHLTEDQISDLPNRYNNPVAVMKDGDGGFVALTDMKANTDNGEEKPVRVYLRPRQWRSGEVVFVATAMAENAADERKYYEPLVMSGLLFADENRIAGLGLEEETESILRTQASGDRVMTASDYSWWSTRNSIAYPGEDVNGGNGVKDGDVVGWNYVSFRDDNIRVDHKWVDGEKRYSVRSALEELSEGKQRAFIHNAEYGDIEYGIGRLGKRGFGLAHIVESRMKKDGDTIGGAVDVAIKVANAAAFGNVTNERYNTKHFDLDGVRAIVAFNDDGNKVITGYEISAEVSGGANRRSPSTRSEPHVSLEEIVAALKSKLASLPTADSIAYPGADVNAPRFSLSLGIEGEEDPFATKNNPVDFLLAHRIFANGGKVPSRKETDKLLKRFGSKEQPRDVLARAVSLSQNIAGFLDRIGQNPEVVRAVAAAGLAVEAKGAQARAQNALMTFDAKAAEAKGKIDAAYRRQVENATGIGYREMLSYYGLDMEQILLAMPPPPQRATKRKDETEDQQKQEPYELTDADLAAVDAAVAAIVSRGEGLAAAANAEHPGQQEKETTHETTDATDDAEADPAFLRAQAMNAAVVEAVRKSGITIDNPLAMVALIRRLTEDYIRRNPDTVPDFNDKDPFHSRVALAVFAANLSQFAQAVAQGYAPSYARVRIARLCERLDGRGLTTLNQVERVGEMIFADLSRDVIRQSRADLMRNLHHGDAPKKGEAKDTNRWRGIDWYAKKHGVNLAEPDRVVSAFAGNYLRILKRTVELSQAKAAERAAKLQETIDAFKDTDDKAKYRDYQNALLELDILAAYGALRTKMPAEIADKAAAIKSFVTSDLDALNARKEAFEQKRVSLRDAMTAAIQGNPKDNGRMPDKHPGFLYSLVGMLDARASVLTSFCADTARRKSALDAFAYVQRLIFHGYTQERAFLNDAKVAMRDAVKSVFGRFGQNTFAKLLDTKLDEATCKLLDRGSQKTKWRIGQVMQMYVSCLQSDYADNCKTHERDAAYVQQLKSVIEKTDPRLLRMIDVMRTMYAEYGREISKATLAASGVPIQTPNPLYMPVKPLLLMRAKNGEGRAFHPYAPALTPRVKHGYDFDQSADIMEMWQDRIQQSAHTIGFLEAAPLIQGTMQSSHVLEAIRAAWGEQYANHWNDYVLTCLAGRKATSMPKVMAALSRAASRLFLWFNVGSNLNQLQAVFTSALSRDVGGIRGTSKHLSFWALKPVEMWQAARDLTATRAFKARYGSDLNAAIAAAQREGKYGVLRSTVGTITDVGMKGIEIGDKIGVLALANVYRSERIALENAGMSPAEASEQAAEKLMLIAENTAQGTTDMNTFDEQSRLGSLTSLFMQFKTAPLQQFGYEFAAFKDWQASPTDPKRAMKLLSTILVNHVLANIVPTAIDALMTTIFGAIRGDDDKEKEKNRRHVVARALARAFLGPFGAVMFYGVIADNAVQFVANWMTESKPVRKPYGSSGSLPSDNAVEMILNAAEGGATALFKSLETGTLDDLVEATKEAAVELSTMTYPGRLIKKAQPKKKKSTPTIL